MNDKRLILITILNIFKKKKEDKKEEVLMYVIFIHGFPAKKRS